MSSPTQVSTTPSETTIPSETTPSETNPSGAPSGVVSGAPVSSTKKVKTLKDSKTSSVQDQYLSRKKALFETNPITNYPDMAPADSFQFVEPIDSEWYPKKQPHDFKTAAQAAEFAKKVKYFVPFTFDSYGNKSGVVDFNDPLPVDFKDREFHCQRNKNIGYKWKDCQPCWAVNSLCQSLNTEEQCLEYNTYCDWDRSTKCKNKLDGVADVYANTLCGKDRENVSQEFCITDLKKGSPQNPALYKPVREPFQNKSNHIVSPKKRYTLWVIVVLLMILFCPKFKSLLG